TVASARATSLTVSAVAVRTAAAPASAACWARPSTLSVPATTRATGVPTSLAAPRSSAALERSSPPAVRGRTARIESAAYMCSLPLHESVGNEEVCELSGTIAFVDDLGARLPRRLLRHGDDD